MSTPAVPTLPPNKSLPPRLRAGDQLAWTVETDLPAGTLLFYVLTATIANVPTRQLIGVAAAGPTAITVDTNGNAAFALTSAVTGAWAPGVYQWVLFAVDASGNRTQLAQDVLRITPDVNGATPVDTRTYNVKLLEAIKSLLQGKALDDVVMYKIGGRELTKMPVMDLERWYGIVEARVRRERIRRGEYVPTKDIGIMFGGR